MPTSFSPRGDAIAILFADEVTFGLPPSGNWTPTLIYSHTLEEKQPYGDDNVMGLSQNNNRDLSSPEPGLPNMGGDIEVPLDLAHLGYWLRSVFGAPSTTGANPNFTHVFNSGLEVLPHRSMEVKLNTTLFKQYTGLFAQGLSLQADYAAGYAHVTIKMMGRKENKLTTSAGGTPPTIVARVPVPKAIAVLKIAGTIIGSITQVRADFDNGAVPQNFIGDPYPQGHDLDGYAKYSGSLTARFRDATLDDLAKAQTAQSFELLWQNTAQRSLSMLSQNVRLEPTGVPIPGPGGIQQSFNWRAEQSASAPMVTATLKSPIATF